MLLKQHWLIISFCVCLLPLHNINKCTARSLCIRHNANCSLWSRGYRLGRSSWGSVKRPGCFGVYVTSGNCCQTGGGGLPAASLGPSHGACSTGVALRPGRGSVQSGRSPRGAFRRPAALIGGSSCGRLASGRMSPPPPGLLPAPPPEQAGTETLDSGPGGRIQVSAAAGALPGAAAAVWVCFHRQRG